MGERIMVEDAVRRYAAAELRLEGRSSRMTPKSGSIKAV